MENQKKLCKIYNHRAKRINEQKEEQRMKKRNRKIRSAMAAALAVSMVAAPCSSALAASTSDEITQREIDNAALAREAAGQGMVLLENENHTLPLKTKKLALFGSGAVRTIKGGFGSGDPFNGGLSGGGSWDVDLNERYNIHIYNTFKKPAMIS